MTDEQRIIVIVNKKDVATIDLQHLSGFDVIEISAKTGEGIDTLESKIVGIYENEADKHDIIITNARHYQALTKASETLDRVVDGLDMGLPGDLISQDIRECMHYLGEITGEISTDDLLGNIFANFCIGK